MRDFEPYTYDYWNNYHERLIKYISHFKKINDDKPKYLYKTDDELLNFNYEFEFFIFARAFLLKNGSYLQSR